MVEGKVNETSHDVQTHDQIVETPNEVKAFEKIGYRTDSASLKSLTDYIDKRCSNIELQVSKILGKFEALEKHVKLD